MNVFFLDRDPKACAYHHCDKHVVKMILESAQILSSVHWSSGGEAPYRLTHENHPCCKWARASLSNYRWLVHLALELCYEYTFRYNKIHKTQAKIEWLADNEPLIEDIGFTEPPQAMPEEYQGEDSVEAYRRYYIGEKSYFAKWSHSEAPTWFLKGRYNERELGIIG